MKTPKQYQQDTQKKSEADRRSEHNADVFIVCIIVFFILCFIFGNKP